MSIHCLFSYPLDVWLSRKMVKYFWRILLFIVPRQSEWLGAINYTVRDGFTCVTTTADVGDHVLLLLYIIEKQVRLLYSK